MKFYLLRHGETEWNKLGKFQGVDRRFPQRAWLGAGPGFCPGVSPLGALGDLRQLPHSHGSGGRGSAQSFGGRRWSPTPVSVSSA